MNLFLKSRITLIKNGPPISAIRYPDIPKDNHNTKTVVIATITKVGIQLILLKTPISFLPKKIPE